MTTVSDIAHRITVKLGFRFNNADSLTAERAAANIIAGKAAFWTNASYSHQGLLMLNADANRLADLGAAIAEQTGHDADWLDRIIPLNGPAAHQLLDAYQRKGTFRSAAEVLARAGDFLEMEAA